MPSGACRRRGDDDLRSARGSIRGNRARSGSRAAFPKVDALKRDWKQFSELKRSVQLRYQETVDVREFEPKIQKLLDDHVVAMPAETIIEVVNINDPDALKAVVEETGVSEASRADRIASATRRAITEKMDEDPTFYKQFSELLEETIRAYREKRLSEREYLNSVVDLASKVARKDRGRDVPESIRGDEDAQAFFGILDGRLKTEGDELVAGDDVAAIAQQIIDIIKSHLIVDIWSNEVAQNNLRNAIDDYFFDVLRDEQGIDLPVEVLDDLELKIMDLPRTPERRFVAGETHLYLGRQYRLKVVPHVQESVKLIRSFIVVQTHRPNRPEVTRELVEAWYRDRAHIKFPERIELCLGLFPDPEAFRPKGLIVRQTRQRWGSMSPAGRLLLNRRLVQAPGKRPA